MWAEWPEADRVMSAVRLVGFLACGGRWQPAMNRVSGFVGFGSTAIAVDRAPTERCLTEAHWYGIGVVHADEVIQPGRIGPVPTARPSVISRWVEELVYQRLIEDGALDVPSPA
jgi:hypothetical protein